MEKAGILVYLTFPILPSFVSDIYARPKQFVKVSAYAEDSDEEESTVGKMPPSDSEDE